MLELLRRHVHNKKVLLLGYGREGKSTLRLLKQAGGFAELAIADQAPLSGGELEGITVYTGKDYQACLERYDIIFKSPGIVLEHPDESLLSRVTSQTELFLERYRDQVIGVTGTKGKSTTATLLFHALIQSGRPCVLAGNIGIPAFDTLSQMTEDTTVVYELSCHQLEYTRVSPHIALFLNLYEEHLDHYITMERYAAAKRRIYQYQTGEDCLICRADCAPDSYPGRLITFAQRGQADIRYDSDGFEWDGRRYILPAEEISLVGEHNVANIAAAYAAAAQIGVRWEEFLPALRTYRALPHRLQLVGEVDGVRYYDDSISTICESAIQAMHSLSDIGSVLIGGMDRGIDYTPLEEYLCTAPVDHVILMYDTGKRIAEELRTRYPDQMRADRLHVVEDLAQAVALAKQITRKGKRCLLSPAAASYGFFTNFEERGDVFQALVMEK